MIEIVLRDVDPDGKVSRHRELCDKLNEIYEAKNKAYGDSFGRTYKQLGIVSAITRMNDKWNRLINLATNTDTDCGDESIKDTLVDLANYCLMTVMEIEDE